MLQWPTERKFNKFMLICYQGTKLQILDTFRTTLKLKVFSTQPFAIIFLWVHSRLPFRFTHSNHWSFYRFYDTTDTHSQNNFNALGCMHVNVPFFYICWYETHTKKRTFLSLQNECNFFFITLLNFSCNPLRLKYIRTNSMRITVVHNKRT